MTEVENHASHPRREPQARQATNRRDATPQTDFHCTPLEFHDYHQSERRKGPSDIFTALL